MDTFQESFRQALEILVQHWEQEKNDLLARISDLEQYADVSIIKSLSDELHVLKMENTTLKRRLKNDDTRSYLSESIRTEPSVRTAEQSVRTAEPSVRSVEPSVRTAEPSVRTEQSVKSVETSNARKQRGRPVVVKPKKNTDEQAREKEQLEAAERQAREQEQLEAAEKQAREQEQLEAAEKQAREQEQLEAAERQAREQELLEAAEKQAREQEQLEAAERQAREQEQLEAERSGYKAVKIKGVQYYTFQEQIYDTDYKIVGRIEQGRARFNKPAA